MIASPELQRVGVSDLLFAELSAKSIEFVEREELNAVTKEIELAKLLGADATASRLKIGQLTKADALVLLSVVEHEKQRFVKLVICDCRYGARLRIEHFLLQKQAADKLATAVADVVAQTQTKFAGGVGRIVAVSPLLSNNLSHEFDHFQSGLATVLAEAISQQPGVAVLEFEEARAIGDELGKTGTELEGRRVPLFVEGEFEVVTAAKPEERTFKLRLRH